MKKYTDKLNILMIAIFGLVVLFGLISFGSKVCALDLTPPDITIIGSNPTDNFGEAYIDAGAMALDDVDGDLTSSIIVTNPVNILITGVYTVTYVVSDSSGNTSTSTRQVNVIDNIAPVITVLGSNPISIKAGSIYNDAGATSLDNFNGSVEVVTSGSVNTGSVGEYILTYTATDSFLNVSTTTRTVFVTPSPRRKILTASVLDAAENISSISTSIAIPEVVVSAVTTTVEIPSTTTATLGAPIEGQVLGVSTFIFNLNIKKGNSNDDVKELQKRLITEGVYSGSITGYFGSVTLKAVKDYQVKNKLPQTGFVGPMTRAILNK